MNRGASICGGNWPCVCRHTSQQHKTRSRKACKGSTLALKPRADVTRSPKQGYQWPHEKDLRPPNFFFKKTNNNNSTKLKPENLFCRDGVSTTLKLEALEWLVALDDDGDVIRDAIDPLFSLLKTMAAQGEYPLKFWVEMRIMATSDAYLSPGGAGM